MCFRLLSLLSCSFFKPSVPGIQVADKEPGREPGQDEGNRATDRSQTARLWLRNGGPGATWAAEGCRIPQVQLDTIEPTVLVNNLRIRCGDCHHRS